MLAELQLGQLPLAGSRTGVGTEGGARLPGHGQKGNTQREGEGRGQSTKTPSRGPEAGAESGLNLQRSWLGLLPGAPSEE